MSEGLKYLPCGDNGIIIEVGSGISEKLNKNVRGLVLNLENCGLMEIIEVIPAYNSVLVIYDPLKTSYMELLKKLEYLSSTLEEAAVPPSEVIHIPVCYGGEYGIDLGYVAMHNGLTPDEVIQIHSSTEYLIYMIGFAPGFPYLGGMSERISTPRLSSPREKIPAGSVGIAGNQTGIYPVDSPGGWRIIGRTPIKLFDPYRDPAVLLRASQYIKFEPVERNTYDDICEEVRRGSYKIEISVKM